MSNLSSVIKSIQDTMRKDAGVDGDAQRISQLGWMLFLKIFDAKETDWEISNDDYKSQILKDLQSAGNAGEFYTPRAVTHFLVEMVNPKLGETIIDPACGTGGFLVNAVEHIKKNHKLKTEEDFEKLQSCIRGVEKKPLP